MKKNVEENEVDLLEFFVAIKRKAFFIIATTVLCSVIAFGFTTFFVTPQYDSTTKIYVMAKENNDVITSSDLQTGSLLTKDYVEMVKSAPVMEKVIEKLDLRYSPQTLASHIMVETPPDTRVIKITVRHKDPYMARDIANEVRLAANIQIKDVMNIDIINTVERANFPIEPSTPNMTKNVLIGFILGFLASTGFVLWMYLIDDTLKTAEDVEKYLGLNVLTVVPMKKGTRKARKRVRRIL